VVVVPGAAAVLSASAVVRVGKRLVCVVVDTAAKLDGAGVKVMVTELTVMVTVWLCLVEEVSVVVIVVVSLSSPHSKHPKHTFHVHFVDQSRVFIEQRFLHESIVVVVAELVVECVVPKVVELEVDVLHAEHSRQLPHTHLVDHSLWLFAQNSLHMRVVLVL
jgi:hypothetical protein